MTSKAADELASALARKEEFSAGSFRNLVEAFTRVRVATGQPERDTAEQRRALVNALIEHHVPDARWRELLHRARVAAEQGEHEFQLLRFPAQACSDGGRAINTGDAGWEATLTGDAAELARRFDADLRPRGFQLTARVLEYPHGALGDAGLFLSWAE